MRITDCRSWCILMCSLIAAGCAGPEPREDGPPVGGRVEASADPGMPGPEPKSRYGNPPFYEQFGRRYHVLPTGAGYRERGVASWYGRKFHGERTSSGEIYDMHAMTAAHKTLPLPTWVEVTNLRNRRSIVVRVNDRGPFVANRIIDLSYAAALELDIVEDGTGLVEVRALDFGNAPPRIQATSAAGGDSRRIVTAAPDESADAEPAAAPPVLYAQVGAFSNRDNAERLHARLLRAEIDDAFIYEDATDKRRLYRVRIGPIPTVEAYDAMVLALKPLGVDSVHMIIE